MIWNQHAALFFPHLRGGEDRHDQDTSTTFQHSWGILWQGLWSLGASSWKQRAIVWMVNQPLFTWNINPSSPETSTPLHLKHQSTLKKQKYQCHYHQKKSTFRFSVFFIVGSFQKILDKGDILWYMTCFSVVVPLSWFPPFGCKPTEIWSRPSLMVFGLLDLWKNRRKRHVFTYKCIRMYIYRFRSNHAEFTIPLASRYF